MASLFEAMARHRPEWLAQGLLMRAVATEPRVRALLIERLGGGLDASEVPEVTEEEVTEGGWRADVSVAWRSRTALLELKLLAGFTERQEQALRARKVSLVVLPSAEGRKLPSGLPILTWKEVAQAVANDDGLKRLLGEVSAASTWTLEDVKADEVKEDFQSFLAGGEDSDWRHMYRFLSTVDLHLIEGAPQDYRASDAWTRSRRKDEPYFGFRFWLGEGDTPRFWLGFWHSPRTERLVFGVTVLSERGQPVLLEEAEQLSARALAERVLVKARQHVSAAR